VLLSKLIVTLLPVQASIWIEQEDAQLSLLRLTCGYGRIVPSPEHEEGQMSNKQAAWLWLAWGIARLTLALVGVLRDTLSPTTATWAHAPAANPVQNSWSTAASITQPSWNIRRERLALNSCRNNSCGLKSGYKAI
jgi:hypothetical protein